MIIFSALYGFISYTFSYFGEMATYLGMTAPMAFWALISWLKNPYNGNKAEVKINRISKKEYFFMWAAPVNSGLTVNVRCAQKVKSTFALFFLR